MLFDSNVNPSATTLPVPLARNSKSALDEVVVTTFVLMFISSTCNSDTQSFDHEFVLVPKLNVLVLLGTKLLLIPATICILSVPSSPIVTLPPIVTFPLTSKLPVMSTLSNKLIAPLLLLKLIAPTVLDNVLPVNLKLPTSIRDPFINEVSLPVVNVAPVVKSTFSAFAVKLTVPAS